MRHSAKRGGRAGLVTASEIACYAYCPEQWRLQYGLGLPAENRKALDAGTRHHAKKAAAERVAGVWLAFGRLLVVLAVMVLILLLVFSR
jgi:hypothetical protein